MKKYKAYSLVEIMVTLGIIGILIVMLFNIILLALRSNTSIAGRSFIRAQISSTLTQISREVRNSDGVSNCFESRCEISLRGKNVVWELCDTSICRYEDGELTLQTSDTMVLESFNFDSYPASNRNEIILVTIVGSHRNEALNINNVVNQISASTRNYE